MVRSCSACCPILEFSSPQPIPPAYPLMALLTPAPLLQDCSTDLFSCRGPQQCSPSCPTHAPQLPSDCPTFAFWQGGTGWGEHRQASYFCVCPPAQMVLLPNTPPTSTDIGNWVGQHPRSHGWDTVWARKRCCICGTQLTIIYFYLEINDLAWYTPGKKKNPLKEFALIQKQIFLSNHFGYSFVPWMFSMLRVCNEILAQHAVNCSTLHAPGNIMYDTKGEMLSVLRKVGWKWAMRSAKWQ